MDCVDPNCEELDLENFRGTFTGVTGAGRHGGATTGAGYGADGEGTCAAKERRPLKTARSRPGGTDGSRVGAAPAGGGSRCVRGCVKRDERRTSMPLFRFSIGALGQKHRLQLIRYLHREQDPVTARVGVLVDRSLPTFVPRTASGFNEAVARPWCV